MLSDALKYVTDPNKTLTQENAMSPDQMDALEPFIEKADPAIRAIYKELKLTRVQIKRNLEFVTAQAIKDKQELAKQIQDGFAVITSQCLSRLESCNYHWKETDKELASLDKGQAVNKIKLGMVIGSTALGGGVLAKLCGWLMK